jgi:hypothetical protein
MKKQPSLRQFSPSDEQWGDKKNAITEPCTNYHSVSWKDYQRAFIVALLYNG